MTTAVLPVHLTRFIDLGDANRPKILLPFRRLERGRHDQAGGEARRREGEEAMEWHGVVKVRARGSVSSPRMSRQPRMARNQEHDT